MNTRLHTTAGMTGALWVVALVFLSSPRCEAHKMNVFASVEGTTISGYV